MRPPEAPPSERPLVLPPRVRIVPLADACRNAALSFLRGADRGWGKRELAGWLAGPYRTLTAMAVRDRRDSERALAALTRAQRARAAGPIAPGALEHLLATSAHEVRATLVGLHDPELGVAFASEALGAGHVHRCLDADGAIGWCPVDLPRMRLAERFLSPIAADYLLRSQDYERKLVVCRDCGAVRFDAERVGLGVCPEHARPSRARVPAARPSAPSS